MTARRCGLCGINYPPTSTACPIHEQPMEWRNDIDPDDDWHDQAERIAKRVIQDLEDGIPIPDLDPDSRFEQDGRTFIYSWDVIQRGVGHRLPDGALLRIGDDVYEVIGYVDALRAYWVTGFSMTLSNRDLRALTRPAPKRRRKKLK